MTDGWSAILLEPFLERGKCWLCHQYTDQSLNSEYQAVLSSISIPQSTPCKSNAMSQLLQNSWKPTPVLCTWGDSERRLGLAVTTVYSLSVLPTSDLWHTRGPEAITTKSTPGCANISGMSTSRMVQLSSPHDLPCCYLGPLQIFTSHHLWNNVQRGRGRQALDCLSLKYPRCKRKIIISVSRGWCMD